MAKLTQFGRMRRRIKRELDAARKQNALTTVMRAAQLHAGYAQIQMIQQTVITAKMLRAWKKEQAGDLKDDPAPVYAAVPVTKQPWSDFHIDDVFIRPVDAPVVIEEERLP